MFVKVTVHDGAGTELVDQRLERLRGERDAFHLWTGTVHSPMGLRLTFEVGVDAKVGLTVRSIDAVLLAIAGFAPHQSVRLRLPTDKVIDIGVYERAQ